MLTKRSLNILTRFPIRYVSSASRTDLSNVFHKEMESAECKEMLLNYNKNL